MSTDILALSENGSFDEVLHKNYKRAKEMIKKIEGFL